MSDFTCPGCGQPGYPTPAQHCKTCEAYRDYQITQAFGKDARPQSAQKRDDGKCPDCGVNEKMNQCSYCRECKTARDTEYKRNPRFMEGKCTVCGGTRRDGCGKCLDCRAKKRREQYQAQMVGAGRTYIPKPRRVAI